MEEIVSTHPENNAKIITKLTSFTSIITDKAECTKVSMFSGNNRNSSVELIEVLFQKTGAFQINYLYSVKFVKFCF